MMKGQLAGLMKQAQAMQENMKKAQDDKALFQGSPVPLHGSNVVVSAAPPFGTNVCSMNRHDS